MRGRKGVVYIRGWSSAGVGFVCVCVRGLVDACSFM